MRGTLLLAQPPVERARAEGYRAEGHRTVPAPEPPPPSPDLATATAVRAFVIAVLGTTLEVLDGRRPRGHLAAVMNDEARDYVADLLAHRVVEHDSARLHRVHIQLRPGGCAEFFGTYLRGARVRAFAGRIEPPASGRGARGASSRADRRWVVAEFGIV